MNHFPNTEGKKVHLQHKQYECSLEVAILEGSKNLRCGSSLRPKAISPEKGSCEQSKLMFSCSCWMGNGP